MDHHVAYLPPPGLPSSSEHDQSLNPQVTHSIISSTTHSEQVPVSSHGSHHPEQPSDHAHHGGSSSGDVSHDRMQPQPQVMPTSNTSMHSSSAFCYGNHGQSGFALYADKSNHGLHHDTPQHRAAAMETENVHQSNKLDQNTIYRPVDLPVSYYSRFMPEITKQSSDYRHHLKTSGEAPISMRGPFDIDHIHQAGDHFSRGSVNPFQPPDMSHDYRIVPDNTKQIAQPIHRENLPHESLRHHLSEQPQHRYQSSSDDSPESHSADRSSPLQPQDLSRSRLHAIANSSNSTIMPRYPYSGVQSDLPGPREETELEEGHRNNFHHHHPKQQSPSLPLPSLHMPFYSHELYRKTAGEPPEESVHLVAAVDADTGPKITENDGEESTASSPMTGRPLHEDSASSHEEMHQVTSLHESCNVPRPEKEMSAESETAGKLQDVVPVHSRTVTTSAHSEEDVSTPYTEQDSQHNQIGSAMSVDAKVSVENASVTEEQRGEEENSSNGDAEESEENNPNITEHPQDSGQHQEMSHQEAVEENTDLMPEETSENNDGKDEEEQSITEQDNDASMEVKEIPEEADEGAAESVDIGENKGNLAEKAKEGDSAAKKEEPPEGETVKQSEDTKVTYSGSVDVSENITEALPADEETTKVTVDVRVDAKWKQVMSESGFGDRHADFAEFLLNFYITNRDQIEQLSVNPKASRRSNSRKSRRPSRQSRSSSEQVVVIADIDDDGPQRQSGESLQASETRPRSRAGRKTAQPKVTSTNRRKGGQRTPRKRKLDDSYLPYSPVPIYKTKPSEPVCVTEGDELKNKKRSSSDRVGVISFSEESSLESGVDDRASDVDFHPPGYHSDSADDDKPINFHKTKLRSHSSSGLNSSAAIKKTECEYILENNNPRAPLKIKFKQSRKLSENQAKREASQVAGVTARTRKPRKPAKPKKTVRAKRPAKPKAKPEEGTAPAPAKRGRKPSRNTATAAPVRQRRGRNSKPITKISWNELIKQYQCKICQYESPCITDMSLHLFDCHLEVADELAKVYSKLEITIGSRTATAFEYLTGRKYDDKPPREEEPEQHKRLPPVSGILSSILSHSEAESRMPPTSEIVMTALSQSIPPATNAMAFLHGAPAGAVFGALSATGALPYIPGLPHHPLGDGSLSSLSGGGYPPNISRCQEAPPLAPPSIDSQTSLLSAAPTATSQAGSISQTSSEADTSSPQTTEANSRPKPLEGDGQQPGMLSCQSEPKGLYLNKFRKSGVDVEQLSKALEVDEVIDLIEKWVKIRTQCPNCHRGIRVSKRTNKHRCRGSDDKPVYVLCDVCGNSYQKEYFSLHYNRIHLQSLVSCNVCHKKFTPSSLPKHLFKHTNPPAAFKCGTCPKSFRFRMDLERHELVHRVDKPYMCPTCGRGFTQKSNMQYHMRQHTGEQPYKCDNCMKSFTHNVSLKNHLKKHHGIDLWAMGYTGGGRPKKEQNIPPVAPAVPPT